MGVIKLYIVFDKPNGEYSAGETLKGDVVVKLEKPTSVQDIQLRLLGEGKVSWSESTGTGDDQTTTWYHNDETYIDQQILLYNQEDAVSAPLVTGSNIFPFSILLPNDLPESFESPNGKVTYQVKVKLKKAGSIFKSKKKKSAPFIVHAFVPIPVHLNEIGIVEDRQLLFPECYCCCSSGKISVKMITDKGGYTPGETISLQVEISNNSSSDLHVITLIMKQEVVCLAKGGAKATTLNKFGPKMNFHSTLRARNTFAWLVTYALNLTYPPTNLGTCKIIEINYFLELEIGESAGCCSPDVLFRCPIMLGSAIPSLSSSMAPVLFQNGFGSFHPQVVTQQPLSFKQHSTQNYSSTIGFTS